MHAYTYIPGLYKDLSERRVRILSLSF